ncbi:hypothetical protein IU498_17615 [Nocardia beijingensis]|uniref:hypothetical protein n=1 Tax=Nocardia beijingensis TaxID=95162 RepID=UPI0018955B43|nr:hypothetical protein [Nocardia beijingensis]MBF6076444.1 hypothetical protein [Nocardia beijingensis]
MPEKFGGKIFYTKEEAEERGLVYTQEEYDRNEAIFEQFARERAAAGPAPEGMAPGFGGRFSDDLEGTEFEGWTRDPKTGQWFDKEGRPVPKPDASA